MFEGKSNIKFIKFLQANLIRFFLRYLMKAKKITLQIL